MILCRRTRALDLRVGGLVVHDNQWYRVTEVRPVKGRAGAGLRHVGLRARDGAVTSILRHADHRFPVPVPDIYVPNADADPYDGTLLPPDPMRFLYVSPEGSPFP